MSERFGNEKKDRNDMLGSFIRHGLSQREAESEVLAQMYALPVTSPGRSLEKHANTHLKSVAGSDTTATALRVTLLHIITNPRVYNTLNSEILSASQNQQISSPITDIEAKDLPYLQAVIKEGLRIWPPVSAWLEKEVPKNGDVIEGRFVPGGTKIAVAGWAMQRAKNVYGQDADVFRPERWLEVDAEKVREMTKVLDLIFGYGRFGCLGRSIAFIELNKVFVEV